MRTIDRELTPVRGRFRGTLKLATLGFVSLWLGAGCSNSSTDQPQSDESRVVPPRRLISSLRSHDGITARSVLSCPAGECIVLHPPLRFVKIRGMRDGQMVDDYARELSQLLAGDPNTSDDDGEILRDKPDEWSTDEALGGSQVTYNCCTYAIRDVVGLSDADWIEPRALETTGFTVPMQILLDSYFRLIHKETASEIDWRRLETDDSFKQDDVFCLVYTFEDHQEFIHVGKILPKKGRNWLVGKFGSGPIVRSSFAGLREIYQGEFEEIRVYRRLPQTLK